MGTRRCSWRSGREGCSEGRRGFRHTCCDIWSSRSRKDTLRTDALHSSVVRCDCAIEDPTEASKTQPPTATAPTAGHSSTADDDEMASANDTSAEAPTGNSISSTLAIQNSSSDFIRISRHHPRMVGYVEAFATRILRGAVVTYPEGAKVLAGHIADLFYAGLDQPSIIAAVLRLLGNSDIHGEVSDVVAWADNELDRLENLADIAAAQVRDQATSNIADAAEDEEMSEADEEESVASSQDDCATELPASASKPFRFLELPAEMRNLIYRLLLAPDGHIGLIRLVYATLGRPFKDVNFPDTVARSACGANYLKLSSCDPQILAVSKQVSEEAKQILYGENTVCVAAALHTGALVFPQRLLPDNALPRLTSLMLVCDAADRSGMEAAWFSGLAWKQLQALTSLKNLRVCVIEREHEGQTTDSKAWILEQILERIPAACQITFESREGFEDTFVQEVIDETQAQIKGRRGVTIDDVFEVERDVLQELAKQYIHKQGCKSGHERDYRFPDRSISTVVSKLKPLSEVDPALVLGGQLR